MKDFTKHDDKESTSDLLFDLILMQRGWTTESEKKRLLDAHKRIMNAAQKIHLKAELGSLDKQNS